MEFVCTQSNLSKGLSQAAPIAGRNKQLPILEYLLLSLQNGILKITATDLDLAVTVRVPGKTEGEFSCTILAKQFSEYIQQLPAANPIKLEFKEKELRISTEGFSAQLPIGADDEFPLLPSVDSEKSISLETDVFCAALTRSIFAAARDDARPELHSVYLSKHEKGLAIAATDSFRLAEEIMEVDLAGHDLKTLLPISTAQDIVRLFGGDSGEDKISFMPSEGHVMFIGSTIEISSRLIDGQYPDYQHIVPTKFAVEGLVDRDDLARALKAEIVFLPRDSKRVQLEVDPKEGVITLQIIGGDRGAGKAEVMFEGTGEKVTALFNIHYLLEGLSHIPAKHLSLQLVGVSEPAALKPPKQQLDYTYVVMPIQA